MDSMVERWLESKGVTLWADWNITDPVQRRKAADWFEAQMQEWEGYKLVAVHEFYGYVTGPQEWENDPKKPKPTHSILYGLPSNGWDVTG